MARFVKTSLMLILSLALVAPISTASRHWYTSSLIGIVTFVVYLYNYKFTKKILVAFLASTVFGVFFSIAFWVLFYIDIALQLRNDIVFLASFFIVFTAISWIILFIKEKRSKKLILLLLNALAVCAFIFLVVYTQNLRDKIWLAIICGVLIGFVIASASAYAFRFFVGQGSKIFSGLTDYIAILLKPFLVFFVGYLLISLIYAGIYNLIYNNNPQALYVPVGQISFLDFFIYSLDTMTTGGNSEVLAQTTLTQAVNTANVFTAIIWMTVMLAATIAYTSESFSEIQKQHKKSKVRDNAPTII